MRRLSWISAAILVFYCQSVAGRTRLSDQTLSLLAEDVGGSQDDLDPFNGALLAPLLQPRVPGTPGSTAARLHVLSFFEKQLPLWNVSLHHATAELPPPILHPTQHVSVPLVNIVATRDPPIENTASTAPRLVLAAHYDSKYGAPPDAHEHHQNLTHGFVGATDSAVACALLLRTARTLEAALARRWQALARSGLGTAGEHGLQVVLLDGEEAFGRWTADDSLHGSRALAAEGGQDDAALLVLLDLLGAPRPSVPSFFRATHWAYQALADVETRLRTLRQLESPPTETFLADAHRRVDDNRQLWRGGDDVADGHLPFWHRGVRILHVLCTPYPAVWHTMDDDAHHLDGPTVRDWARLMAAFAAEWLGLEGYMTDS